MGWTSYHAEHYDKRGNVDRKAEVESQFNEDYEILKSSMVGSTYYGAVKHKGSFCVWGLVVLTHTDSRDYYNFSYKMMDESYGPCYYDCPKGILDLLTVTDSEYANNWRQKCKERFEQKKTLAKFERGDKIRVDGDEYVLDVYNRRQMRWINWGKRTYITKEQILNYGYEVVERK